MAAFSILDMMNSKSRTAAGATTKTEYKEIYLSPYEVKEAQENTHLNLENIEELADSFLHVGQEQPTVLARVNGEFRIIDGHRRNAANIFNLERGYKEYEKVLFRYRDMSEAMYELSLLAGNGYTQELTAYEKVRLVERTKAALLRAKEEDGLEIRGKMRDFIATMMNESRTTIAVMEKINHSATSEVKEQLKNGNMGITAAYEAAKLLPDEQRELVARMEAGEDIRAKEIARKVSERTAARVEVEAEKARKEQEKVKPYQRGCVTGKNPNGTCACCGNEGTVECCASCLEDCNSRCGWLDEKPKRETEQTDQYTKVAVETVLMVSESDTTKTEQSNAEQVVYVAQCIIRQADKVSIEDLKLLHEIMLRSQ